MATIYPSDIDLTQINENSDYEAQTLLYLARNLSKQFTIYHSVHWTLAKQEKTHFGEIDFIIANRAGKVVLIEQKNGPIEETTGGLFKRYQFGSKHILSQINRNLDGLRQQFSKSFGRRSKGLIANYLFYCPDYQVRNPVGCDIDAERIVDSRNKAQLAHIIENLLGKESDSNQAPMVHAFLQGKLHLVPDLHSIQNKQESLFTRASEGLVSIVNNLKMSPFRLKIEGTAGCGKSMLAAKTYTDSILNQKNTLLLCYNRPLAERYANRLPSGGKIATWNAFKIDYLKDQGYKVDFDNASGTDFWDDLETTFEAATANVSEDWKYYTIIIDEGQDFQPTWWLLLEPFLKPNASVLWLEDSAQNIRNVEDERDDIPVVYTENRNYRTPYPIAEYIQATLPFEFDIACPVPGIDNPIQEHFVTDENQQTTIVEQAIKRFLTAGITIDDIAVLTCKGVGKSALSKVTKLAGKSVKKFTGEYTPEGDQILTDGDLVFETVGRFKGKQAAGVVLIDLDLSEGKSLSHRQRIAYTGMTRATLALDVIQIRT